MKTIEGQIVKNDPALEHVPSIYRIGFQENNKKLDALEQEKEETLQQIRDLESGIRNVRRNDNTTTAAWEVTTSAGSIRIGVLASVLFLVQILVSLNRYNTRLAGFYSARADALAILVPKSSYKESIDMEMMERLTEVLSPESLDFGKGPRSVVMQAVETAKSRVHRNTPNIR